MDLECDVLIVGGGPAGLSVASSLADDISSVVVHQDAEIGKPVRTSGGSWVADLEALDIPSKYYNVIDKLDFYSDHEHAQWPLDQKAGAIIDITGLYKYLATLSDAKDRTLLLSTKFISTKQQTDGRYCSIIRNRESGDTKVTSNYIIDASGWHCSVLEDQCLGEKPERRGIGVEYEYELGDNDPRRSILFVGSACPTGYGWIFPTADNKIRVGLGVLQGAVERSPKELLNDFIASDTLEKYGVSVNKQCHVMGGIIPMVRYEDTLVYDKIIRVGDSANFATPTVGEGIRVCIKYGRVLGEKLSDAIKNDNSKHLKDYEKITNKALSRSFKLGFMVSKRIGAHPPENWDASLRRAARLGPRDLISFVRNDFSIKIIMLAIIKQIKAKLFS